MVTLLGLLDEIRRYIFVHYIKPAVEEGKEYVILKAGDIHYELLYHKIISGNRIPAVCNALSSKKSIDTYNDWLIKLGYNVKIRAIPISVTRSGYGSSVKYKYIFMKKNKAASDESNDSNAKYNDITEDDARRIMSQYLGIPLYKKRLNINGKYKEFDLVNILYRIVGDFKNFKYKGQAMAEMSNIVEYIWVMEKLEKYTGTKWRKIIVGAGNRKTFETFARRYDPWLEDVEIYYIDSKHRIVKLR